MLALSLHEGIIEPDIWLKCQHKASQNKQIKNTGKGKHSWLTGLVKCGYCGYGMVVKIYKENKYWVCTGRYATDLCIEKLDTHYLDEVEDAVQNELIGFKETFSQKKKTAKINGTRENELKIELYKVEQEIENLLGSLAASNDVLMTYVNEKITELDSKKTILLKEMNDLIVTVPFEIPDISKWHECDMADKRDIAQKLISKVMLFNDKMEVAWKAEF